MCTLVKEVEKEGFISDDTSENLETISVGSPMKIYLTMQSELEVGDSACKIMRIRYDQKQEKWLFDKGID